MKRTFLLIIIGSLAGALCTFLIGCSEEEAYPTEEIVDDAKGEPVSRPVGEYGQEARRYFEELVDIGSRASGTDEEHEAAQYIADAFSQMGYASELQPFSAESEEEGTIDSANVIAIKDGNSSQSIVVGAHYDGVEDGEAADDNASGVAILLEAAGLVQGVSTPYMIYFVAFGAEEAGLLGSNAFVSSLSTSDLGEIVLMVNLDSVAAGDIPYAYSPENEAFARDWVLEWAGTNGYDLETIWDVKLADEEGYATADYGSFEQAGIPWLYFEATNWTLGDNDGYTQVDPEYGDEGAIIHTEYDSIEYLDKTFPGRVNEHFDLYVAVLYNLLTRYELQ